MDERHLDERHLDERHLDERHLDERHLDERPDHRHERHPERGAADREHDAAGERASGDEQPGPPAATAPSDRTTLTAVVDAYRSSGFAGDFYAEEVPGSSAEATAEGSTAGGSTAGGSTALVRCGRCASAIDPAGLQIHSIRRLEGASDPADMVAVVATTCPVCGSDGTLVLGFGPMSSAVDADVLGAMQDVRGDDVLPQGVAPGETATTDRR